MSSSALKMILKNIKDEELTAIMINASIELNESDFLEIFTCLQRNKVVTRLSIDGHALNPEIMNGLVTLINTNKTLQSLTLKSASIDDSLMSLLSKALKTNQTIKSINLGGNLFSNKGIQSLCEIITVNNTLSSINLENCGIIDENTIALTAALRENHCLTKFSFINLKNKTDNNWQNLEKIDELLSRNKKEIVSKRNQFLRNSIVLAKDSINPESNSIWKKFPKEIRFLVLEQIILMHKTPNQIHDCIEFIFRNISLFCSELHKGNRFKLTENTRKKDLHSHFLTKNLMKQMIALTFLIPFHPIIMILQTLKTSLLLL